MIAWQSLPLISSLASCNQSMSANAKDNLCLFNHLSSNPGQILSPTTHLPFSAKFMSKVISKSEFLTSIKYWSSQSQGIDLPILKEESLQFENFHFKFAASSFVINFSRIGASFIYNNSQIIFIIKRFTSFT